jgi:putative hydrolase of the HAD superfamily
VAAVSQSAAGEPLAGLIVDYGGVLTTSPRESFRAWLQAEGMPPDRFRELMREWLGGNASGGGSANPLHDLETGRLTAEEFERALAERLRGPDGTGPSPDGLLVRMFAGYRSAPGMVQVLRAAKLHGLRTALLSNSWGGEYDRTGWDGLFDAVVISGEVGLRKPDPEIFLLTARRLGLRPGQCVFVDDLAVNVRGAAAAGMVGVHHTDVQSTVDELEALFGLSFSQRAG